MASVSFQSLDERRPLHNETITPENDGFSGVIFSTVEKCLRHFSDKGAAACRSALAALARLQAERSFLRKMNFRKKRSDSFFAAAKNSARLFSAV